MRSHQVVAVNVDSDIYTLQDLEAKNAQLREVAAQAQKANEAKSRFLSRMSHEHPHPHQRHHRPAEHRRGPL